MPTITTQSIGIVLGPMVNAAQAAQSARVSENNAKAGRPRGQNEARAAESATVVQPNKKRAVQDEARIEGVFSEESDSDHQGDESDVPQQRQHTLDRFA